MVEHMSRTENLNLKETVGSKTEYLLNLIQKFWGWQESFSLKERKFLQCMPSVRQLFNEIRMRNFSLYSFADCVTSI